MAPDDVRLWHGWTMTRIALLLAALSCLPTASAQSEEALAQQRFEQTAMGVLGGWSVANLALGGFTWASAEAPRLRGVGQGNLMWNTVNGGIATAGLIGASRLDWQTLSADELTRRQKRMRTAFLVNGGIDLLYIGAGIGLSEWARSRDDFTRQGWGQALVTQGAFLLVFDGVAAWAQHRLIRKRRRG